MPIPSLTREQLKVATAVLLRVPGLFIIDYWWQHDWNKSFPNSVSITDIFNALATNLVVLHGFLLLLLPLPHVKALYNHFLSGCLILSSHLLSDYYVATEKKDSLLPIMHEDINFFKRQLTMIAFHIISGATISCLIDGLWRPFPLVLGCYTLPIMARLANLPIESLEILHNFSCAIVAISVTIYVSQQIPNVLDFLKVTYMNVLMTANVHGFISVLSVLWNKLFVPNHFAVFWLIEFFVKFFRVAYQYSETVSLWGNEWYILLLTAVSSICASPISLIATSVAVSYLSFFVLSGTRAYLMGQMYFHMDNPLHNGWTEGVSLVLLAIQAGLAETKMPDRVAVMTVILFIVLSSLLQSMLEIAEPIVLGLSASRSRSFWRHFRALSVCLFVLVFPLYLTWVLYQVFSIDFWMMVVLSSYMLTSVHVVDLLIVHCLFMYDSFQSELWENLDDIVYYTRAISKVLEFLVAVVVVAMGLWESVSTKWNHMNASILLVHCYINVWQRLRNGWRSFLLRREAAQKSESLPSATEEQLEQLDDVCSICFMSMRAACITQCHHYFHRTCLRKWLYIQDHCPLCHKKISLTIPDSSSEQLNRHAGDIQNADAHPGEGQMAGVN